VFGNVNEEEYCSQKLFVGMARQLKRVEIDGLDADCLELNSVLYAVMYLLCDVKKVGPQS